LTDNELLALFRRGFIPGPEEAEEAFLSRVENRPPLALAEWESVTGHLLQQWGCAVDWVPITYARKRLLPWEGAAFLSSPSALPHLVLKSSSPEILTHEAVHAARETFNEPLFEEFLAYSTSPTRWKRWLGPIFQRVWEFPLACLASFCFLFFPWIAGPIFLFFLIRLVYLHHLFHRMKQRESLAVLLCLTDEEIKRGCVAENDSLRVRLIDTLKRPEARVETSGQQLM